MSRPALFLVMKVASGGYFLCPFGGDDLRRMKKYTPTKFKARDSVYDKAKADYAVSFIECLCHTKGT